MSHVVHDGSAIRIVSAHDGIVWPVHLARLSSGETVLVSAGSHPGNEMKRWDAATGECIWSAGGVGCYGMTVIETSEGQCILGVATSRGIERWDARLGSRIPRTEQEVIGNTIWAVGSCELDDGRSVLFGAGNDHVVHRWDAKSGALVGAPLAGHGISVKSVVAGVVPNRGATVFSGGEDGLIKRWDAKTGECLDSREVSDSDIFHLGLTEIDAGGLVLSCSDAEGNLYVFDAISGEIVGRPLCTDERVGAVAVVGHGDEYRIFASLEGGIVRQWNLMTGHLLDESIPGMSVAALSITGGFSLVVSGTEGGDVLVRKFG